MSGLSEAVSQARGAYRDEEYVSRLKDLVGRQLQALDPTVKIENTNYFNHSAIPDFILSWSSDRATRDFYLRGSYASVILAGDLQSGAIDSPIFFALDSRQDFSEEVDSVTPADIRDNASESGSTLLTDVDAVGDLGDAPADQSGPLTSMVQANFVRGARGLVDQDRAVRLVSTSREEGRTTLSSVLRETFSTDAFLRMERTAAIVDLAVTELDERNPDDMLELTAKLTGRLSEAEMASVIPWVIKSQDVEQPPIFWRQLGALFSFEDLEKVARLIAGDDVSELIRANAEQWYVRRAQVEPTNYDDVDRATKIWKFLDGVLTVDTDYHRVSLSTHGRSLRGKAGSTLPQWRDLGNSLAGARLQSVDLRGVSRSVRIDAEESDDIRLDVESVTSSLEDNYRVAEVTLRFTDPVRDNREVDVTLDVAKSLAQASKQASIKNMTDAALRVLTSRNPVTADEIERITAPVQRAAE